MNGLCLFGFLQFCFILSRKSLMQDHFFLLSWERLPLTLDRQEFPRWKNKYRWIPLAVSRPLLSFTAADPVWSLTLAPLFLQFSTSIGRKHHWCPSTNAPLSHKWEHQWPRYLKWCSYHQRGSHKGSLSHSSHQIILHLLYKWFLNLKWIIFVHVWINEED